MPRFNPAWLAFCISAALVATIACGRPRTELDKINRLHLTAMAGPGGSDAQLSALRELAESSDPRVDGLLVHIATSAAEPGGDKLSAEAVRQLRLRGAGDAIPGLAPLLSPDREIVLRRELALTYAQLGCPPPCLKATLHYLERIWEGELNVEERRFARASRDAEDRSFVPRLASAVVRQQEQIYEALYAVLRRAPQETATALSEAYGVGGPEPAPFALHLIAYLQLHEACPALLASREAVPAPDRATEVLSAIEEAACEP